MRKFLRAGVAFTAFLVAGSALAETTITFRFNDEGRAQMRAALDEFESENPDIKVKLETISWNDARQQFIREASVGQGPDVAHIAFVWNRELAEAGIVQNVDELAEKYGPLPNGFDDFLATDLTEYQNAHWGVPWSADTWAMVYRTDVLKEAGIEQLPKTWDELLSDSRTIKEKTGKTGFAFAAGNQVWFPVNYYLWSQGVSLVVGDGATGFKVGATEADIAAAMDYFHTYVAEGLVPRSILSIDVPHDPVLQQALLDGSQAIGIMPTNSYRQLIAAYEKTNPGKPLPFVSGITMAGTQAPESHLGGRTLVVNKNTENPEAAWKLVQFLTEAKLFEKYYTDQFPAQRTLLSEIKFRPEEAGFAEQLGKHTRSWGPYSETRMNIGQIWNLTARSFGEAMSDQTGSKAAAAALLDELRSGIGK
jgi:multiple sugar transport system substrate-binding protein